MQQQQAPQKINREQAVQTFTADLPNLNVKLTTNYRVAQLFKAKLIAEGKIPAYLVDSVIASMWMYVSPKVFRNERELVERCMDGLVKYIGNLYAATIEDFTVDVFRSMAKSLTFVLDW